MYVFVCFDLVIYLFTQHIYIYTRVYVYACVFLCVNMSVYMWVLAVPRVRSALFWSMRNCTREILFEESQDWFREDTLVTVPLRIGHGQNSLHREMQWNLYFGCKAIWSRTRSVDHGS